MKFRTVRNRPVFRKNDKTDDKKLLITAFQWLYAVIWVMFLFVLLFGVVFRVVSFRVKTADGMRDVGVIVTSMNYAPETGDKIMAFTGKSNFLGEIVAVSNTDITVGSGKTSLVDCVIYQNKWYFSAEELQTVLKNLKVPKNCVLIKESVSENNNFRVGEIVEVSHIIGRAECLAYPFHLAGKPVSDVKNI